MAKSNARAFQPDELKAMGYVEGIDFYVNHSGRVISMRKNEDRLCEGCGQHKTGSNFYSALHKTCRACQRRAREGVEPGSPEAIQRDLDAKQGRTQQKAIEILAPQAEIAQRILARRRLLHFIQRFYPGYKAGWVHRDICRRLERFMHAVAEGKSPRLLLFMPPRHGKSLIASQLFPAWMLGHHPEFEIIAASYNISLPTGFSRRIRDTLRDPAYQAMFADTRLSDESQAVEAWRTTKGGGYAAAGVGTGITGKGAHVLIIDDPIKDWQEADSAIVRDSTWDWYLSTAYTRIAPGGGVLGIQTRWNDDDWAGRIVVAMNSGEGEPFEIVSYPAINEQGHEYLCADDSIIQLPPEQEPPEGATLLREQNSALHTDRYDIAALTRIKRNFAAAGNTRMWSALYQQNPVPDEGAFFRREMFQYVPTMPSLAGMNIYQAWDFSITEKEKSDWIVGACLAQDANDNVYELDMVRFRVDEDAFALADGILNFHMKWNPYVVGFEDGQIWKSIKAVVMRRAEEKRVALNYHTLTPLTDKIVRAGPLRGRMQMGKMYFRRDAPFRDVVEQELLRFPAGKHDDIVDAYAWAMRLTLEFQPPVAPKPKQPKGWLDKLRVGRRGTTSHMAS